eukprot:2602221-Amphidinium_carterae.2
MGGHSAVTAFTEAHLLSTSSNEDKRRFKLSSRSDLGDEIWSGAESPALQARRRLASLKSRASRGHVCLLKSACSSLTLLCRRAQLQCQHRQPKHLHHGPGQWN